MELQKQFSQEYLTDLKNKVYDPDYIKIYDRSTFKIEENEENVVKIPGLYMKHVDLKETDKATDDFDNAVAFFEAYKDMSPIVASQESIWAYFTHVEYYSYVKKRWNISSETSPSTLIEHFFVNGILKIARNGIGRLWWPVFLTYDEENTNPYHLTKILFSNTEAVMAVSESQFFSCKPLTHGVLQFFENHPDVKISKKNVDYIIQYFNALGGVRELCFESKESITKTIETENIIKEK